MTDYSGDMIVNLMGLPGEVPPAPGVRIKRAFAGDRKKILQFVQENFSDSWVQETETALMQVPSTCFLAEEKGKIVGFACYDVSARDFFGPIGVRQSSRGKGIGQCLLLRCLYCMREMGYAYAIIGWVGEAENFYRKTVKAEYIPGGDPLHSVYGNIIGIQEKLKK